MAVAKAKKKNWYGIIAPALFHKQSLGEIHVSDPMKAVGRTMTVNLMSITNDPKRQNISIKFKITDFRDNKFVTDVLAYQMSPSSIKRFIRRGRNRVDDSFLCKTSDGKNVKVKPLFLTQSATKKSVLTLLRIESRKMLRNYISKMGYEAFINDLVSHKVQSQLRSQLKRVYPLRTCEIRLIELAKEKIKAEEKQPEEKKEEPKEEKKEPEKEKVEAKEEIKKEAPKEKEIKKEEKPEQKKEVKEPETKKEK